MQYNARKVGSCLRSQWDYVRVCAIVLRKEKKGERSLMYSGALYGEAQKAEITVKEKKIERYCN